MDNSLSIYICSLFAIIVCTFYKYLTRNNGYWKSRGIPEAKGVKFIFGHMKDIITMKKNIGSLIEEIHKDHRNDSMVGIYEFHKPVLIVRDPELIKQVLQTKFSSFSAHSTLDPKVDPLLAEDPFFKNDQEWKDSRAFFTNAYSAKKIKDMVPAVKEVVQKFLNFMNTKVRSTTEGVDIEVKEIFSKYTAATSASTVLGIDAQTFVDKDSPDSLRSMMDALFIPRTFKIRQTLAFLIPALSNFLGMGFVPDWINKGFSTIIDDIVSSRKNDNIPRNDILQLIINQLKEKKKSEKFTAAYAFGFFVEIYESSSMTLSAMSYFLAKNPKIQDKAREETERTLEKYGELSYEAVNNLTYLEQVIKETLRCLPIIGRLLKICTEPVTLEGPDGLVCNLKKDDEVIIPVTGLHMDPKHWDDPEEFRPERFDKNYDMERNRYTYLPFGEGARMCPGLRFGILQIKMVMAIVLTNYVLESSEKMKEPIRLDPRSFLSTVEGGYWIKMRRRVK